MPLYILPELLYTILHSSMSFSNETLPPLFHPLLWRHPAGTTHRHGTPKLVSRHLMRELIILEVRGASLLMRCVDGDVFSASTHSHFLHPYLVNAMRWKTLEESEKIERSIYLATLPRSPITRPLPHCPLRSTQDINTLLFVSVVCISTTTPNGHKGNDVDSHSCR